MHVIVASVVDVAVHWHVGSDRQFVAVRWLQRMRHLRLVVSQAHIDTERQDTADGLMAQLSRQMLLDESHMHCESRLQLLASS